ncbi:MAG: hypothetical protein ACREMB_22465 [Candidatus Rokuibacteriota bacterium]
MFDDLRMARADGTYGRLLGKLARMELHITRRLGLGPAAGLGAPRPARDSRGPVWEPLHDRHEPALPGPVARSQSGSPRWPTSSAIGSCTTRTESC